jgi:manganese transport protein
MIENKKIKLAWRRQPSSVSLPEVHRSIEVPQTASFFRKLLAFAGPGYLVAVGYMDPGNWATAIAGGSQFSYSLLSVIMISNLMAMLLQALSAKLGIVTGRDLAQACRDHYSRPVNLFLWFTCEIAIAACDLAEVIGSAIALNLLFGLPLVWGVCITAADVLVILYLQNKGFRYLEVLVVSLIVLIGGAFLTEIIISHSDLLGIAGGFIPSKDILSNREMLYIAIGILGATVMPHNLYLHSSIVQTRRYPETDDGRKMAIKFATIDSTLALFLALFVNAGILIVSANVFFRNGYHDIVGIERAYELLSPLLGVSFASLLFALALLAAGQNATITGTLAGQIVMEGFLNLRLRPVIRRLITRLIAIVPAIIVTVLYGASGTTKLLILSQVILSLQLSFAVFPLVNFTSDRAKMGQFVNSPPIKYLSYFVASIIALLNSWLLFQTFREWLA